MDKANKALTVYNRIQRHAAKLEQIDFLLVNFRNLFVRIGQARKWDMVLLPITNEFFQRIRPNRQDFRIVRREFRIAVSQARQLRAAERSHETAQEGKHNNFLPAEIRKAIRFPINIIQLEIRCRLTFE
jgi:hypothetical protein